MNEISCTKSKVLFLLKACFDLILQMYNQQIENVKEKESSLIIRRPREPSLDYLPEFLKKEPGLEEF